MYKKYTDTAMALAFLSLVIGHLTQERGFLAAATLILLAAMVHAPLFHWPARFWFGLSHLLGGIVSKLLLSLIFFLLVTPIALIRRLSGKDSLLLSQWKRHEDSVFVNREHTYVAADLTKPY